ncbi:hypothetical protein NKH77_53085 [Streptomyces sp. M19]
MGEFGVEELSERGAAVRPRPTSRAKWARAGRVRGGAQIRYAEQRSPSTVSECARKLGNERSDHVTGSARWSADHRAGSPVHGLRG